MVLSRTKRLDEPCCRTDKRLYVDRKGSPRCLHNGDIDIVGMSVRELRFGTESVQDRQNVKSRGQFEMPAENNPCRARRFRRRNVDRFIPRRRIFQVRQDFGFDLVVGEFAFA